MRILAAMAFIPSAVVQVQPAALAQTEPDPAVSAATMQKLTALRDNFAQKAKSDSPACTLAPPTIEIKDTPSFGNYVPETNTLEISAWWLLTPERRAFFRELAGKDADEDAARRVFENGTHRWVFIHELGHWWQACTGFLNSAKHYQVEYDANRIAAAYWRENDPGLMQGLASGFEHMLSSKPSPVPTGQPLEDYFNANYDSLGLRPDYVWFQARMVSDVNAEKPAPSFADALMHSQPLRK
jgi:hypothetical protein